MLRRILLVALIAGAVAGLVATLVQGARLWPLIAAAEQFEQGGAASHHHGDAAPAHDHDWQPEDGAERIAFTALFNILAGFGFALLLNGALALRQTVLRGATPDIATGALWGLAGFVCFALAPALGLPPELPGMQAADLLDRQVWWAATALASAAGLALLAFARGAVWKVVGLVVLAAPHVIGAPYTHETGSVPAELAAQFVAASLVAAAVFWIVLGALSGWLHRRLA
ncbi:MAG TPA: CbtA family protein [Alphaproteobacteria bacterium]|nr:CbtA family protein [Alphaproteobacteria bacterium]